MKVRPKTEYGYGDQKRYARGGVGYGDGNGNEYGDGVGNGSGYGNGYGVGYGDGNGNGYGDGDGEALPSQMILEESA